MENKQNYQKEQRQHAEHNLQSLLLKSVAMFPQLLSPFELALLSPFQGHLYQCSLVPIWFLLAAHCKI